MSGATLSPSIHIGVMSGTSLDGVDVAVLDFAAWPPRLIDAHTASLPDALRDDLMQLTRAGQDHIDLLGRCDVHLGRVIADAVVAALQRSRVGRDAVAAIGSHGQTLRHRPDEEAPFTLQIGDPAVIAERTGIRTVADFRRADVAAGGQGAPLVPAYHAALFMEPQGQVVVANIGGIANVTLLTPERVTGFDTGPGNILSDAWAARYLNTAYDPDGAFAARGTPHTELLEVLMRAPYFTRPPPKSTGREAFNLEWLEAMLANLRTRPEPEDVQATLIELTAQTLVGALPPAQPVSRMLIAGGGRHNATLMRRLGALMHPTPVEPTAVAGVEGDWLEAMAFAWLARERLAGRPANVPTVTGAAGPRVLGAVHLPPSGP